jgi:predicted NAD/FAD-dependent oxidoreductase
LIIAIVIISIIISLLIFLNRNKPEGEQIDWASLNEDQQSEKLVVSIPDSQVDELFENQEDDAILQRLQAAGLDLPEGWTLEEYSQWLDGPLPEGWVDEQWQIYRGEKLAIIESQQLF